MGPFKLMRARTTRTLTLATGWVGFSKVKGGRSSAFGAFVQWPTAVADFNHDGKLDVALSSGNEAPDVTSIYLGDGAGKFTGLKIRGVDGQGAVADMNGDGELDFVTNAADESFTYLNIYLESQSRYQLTESVTLGEGFLAGAPVVGDFNNDGKLDVVMTGKNIVRVFLGNGDGNLDIVTNGARVLLGAGDATFTNGSCGAVSNPYGSIVLADFNGDGKLDIATTNSSSGTGDNSLSILLGNGDGTFQNPIAFDLSQAGKGWGNNTFGVADFNDDGKLDLAIGGGTSSVVLLQRLKINKTRQLLNFAGSIPGRRSCRAIRFVWIHIDSAVSEICLHDCYEAVSFPQPYRPRCSHDLDFEPVLPPF